MAANSYIKDAGGTWRTAQSIRIKDAGGTWRTATAVWVKDAGGTWRKVFQPAPTFSVSIPAVAPAAYDSSLVSLTFGTDGALTGSSVSDQWGAPITAGAGSAYWVRATLGAGTGTVGGTFGLWLQLSTARAWQMSAATVGAIKTRDVLFEIASDSAGATIVSSRTITFTSDRT